MREDRCGGGWSASVDLFEDGVAVIAQSVCWKFNIERYVLVLIEYIQSINRAHLQDCRGRASVGASVMIVVISARSFMWTGHVLHTGETSTTHHAIYPKAADFSDTDFDPFTISSILSSLPCRPTSHQTTFDTSRTSVLNMKTALHVVCSVCQASLFFLNGMLILLYRCIDFYWTWSI